MHKITTLLLLLLFTTQVFAVGEKVIWGIDNRKDVFEVSNSLHVELARSTAGMVSTHYINDIGNGYYSLIGRTVGDAMNLCSSEPFVNQMAAANCSGFLVGDDLLVTAGHCVDTQYKCKNYKWVFDFKMDGPNQFNNQFSEDQIYGCKEIIETIYEGRRGKKDHALIRLDRKVVGRTPLQFRRSGKIAQGADLVVIGHPSMMPTKISDGGNVIGNYSSLYFETNLDTFKGNSGSAVFDANTGLLEGILVRGANDYVPRGNCYIRNYCTNSSCRMKEEVTRITNIKWLKNNY